MENQTVMYFALLLTGALLSYIACKAKMQSLENDCAFMADLVCELQTENDQLERELEIATSISTQLHERLATRLAGVYAGYEPNTQSSLHQHQPNQRPEKVLIKGQGNEWLFVNQHAKD